jgi:DNA primase
MIQLSEIDYISKAPAGKEVEDLTKKEIFKCLRERVPIKQYRTEPKTKELKEFIENQPANILS